MRTTGVSGEFVRSSRAGLRRSGRGIGFVAFVTLGVAVALLQTATSPGFDATGMAYIDISRHIAKGDGIAASIFFPSHVPKFPSPVSLWPPLYPAVIAGVSKLGLDSLTASRIVSIAAFGVSVGLVWLLGSAVLDESVGAIAGLLLLAWPPVTDLAAMALSENLFVMLVLLSVLVSMRLLRGDRSPAQSYAVAVCGGLAMAGAALTRYPGIALIAIGATAVLVSLQARHWKERLGITFVWSLAATLPTAILLMRNRLVTGAFMGTGRPPNDRGFVFHAVYAVKAVSADGLKLLWRITVVPEALGLDSRVMALGVMGAIGLLLFGVVRSDRVRRSLLGAIGALAASPEMRFVVLIGAGYWTAMAIIRSVTTFELLNTRMMMPAYPLVLVSVVAFVVVFAERIGLARRVAVWTVALLFVGSVAVVGVPQAVEAGGPRLRPDPPPVWVTWVSMHAPPNTPIVGNRTSDFNFYLESPVYSFQVFAAYPGGHRFDRDCRLIAKHLATLGWKHAYLVLHSEDGAFDADTMGRRYGPTIAQLLQGQFPLPVRLMVRDPEFVAFEILGLQWSCTND